MLTNCNCPCAGYQRITKCCCSEQECLISKLKAEIFEREQNLKNYCCLEAKFCQLQKDLQLLCDTKNHLECELNQITEDGNKMITELKAENEDLVNQINDKIAVNKKYYSDNNNLYRNLENRSFENQELQNQMAEQEALMKSLSQVKSDLERKILNLNQNNEDHINNINSLNDQICKMTVKSDEQCDTLKTKNCQNQNLLKLINDQKLMNANLCNDLQNKEENINCTTQKLNCAKDTLNRLECDFSNLTCKNNKCKNDIDCMNNNLLKENNQRNQVDGDNRKLEDMINLKNMQISKMKDENNCLSMCINQLNGEGNNLDNELKGYKNHILVLTEQNSILSKELEDVIDRDNQIKSILNRDDRIRKVEMQNKQAIENSLNNLKNYMNTCGVSGTSYVPKQNYNKDQEDIVNTNIISQQKEVSNEPQEEMVNDEEQEEMANDEENMNYQNEEGQEEEEVQEHP